MAVISSPRHRPGDRSGAVAAAGRLLVLARALNANRPPDHREALAQAIASTREYFRSADRELPADRDDALLRAIHELLDASETSPQGYELACAELRRMLETVSLTSSGPLIGDPAVRAR